MEIKKIRFKDVLLVFLGICVVNFCLSTILQLIQLKFVDNVTLYMIIVVVFRGLLSPVLGTILAFNICKIKKRYLAIIIVALIYAAISTIVGGVYLTLEMNILFILICSVVMVYVGVIDEVQNTETEVVNIQNKETEKTDNNVQVAEKIKTRETRMRCDVCGHIFCYTFKDLQDNATNTWLGLLSSAGSIATSVGGSSYHVYEQGKSLERDIEKVKDYSKCPKCNSRSLTDISDEEFSISQSTSTSAIGQLNVADEIKKFKDLLDSGAITQEEFDAKKKQLLGL